MKPWQGFVKGLINVVAAVVALVVLWPVLLVVAVLVRVTMGRPILFRQVRAGLEGKPFVMCKFRTMNELRDADGNLLPDAERLTPLGRMLRKTSLDELPQLWNVLKREMSLVGPRPLFIEYLERYTPEQHRRHEVRPGITGWAQVNGRQAITFSKRLELDLWYVDHFSLRLDLKILLRTALLLVVAKGVLLDQEVAEVDDLGLSRDCDRLARSHGAVRLDVASKTTAAAHQPPADRVSHRAGRT